MGRDIRHAAECRAVPARLACQSRYLRLVVEEQGPLLDVDRQRMVDRLEEPPVLLEVTDARAVEHAIESLTKPQRLPKKSGAVMLLAGRQEELCLTSRPDRRDGLEDRGVEARVLSEPIVHEVGDAALIAHVGKNQGQRVLQVAPAHHAGLHRRFRPVPRRAEEKTLEGLAIHAEVRLDRQIPGLAAGAVGVPAVDQHAVDIEEYLHRLTGSGAPCARTRGCP